MNLLCPNCQKMLQVPEQYAGQMMKCPLCTGTFTVPALPQAPAAPPPPPPPAPAAAPSHAAVAREKPAAPAPAPASTPTGYAHTRSYVLKPTVLAWLPAVALLLVFLLMFFSWIGMYPAGNPVVTQSGWFAAFGGKDYPVDVYQKTFPDEVKAIDEVGAAPLLVIFILLFLPTLLLAVAGAAVDAKLVPVALPAAVEQFWPWRQLVVAALMLMLFGLVFLQSASSFPLETRMHEYAEKQADKLPEMSEKSTRRPDYIQMFQGREYGRFDIERTTALSLVQWALFLGMLAALAGGWVARRGEKPVPRLDLHY